MQFLSIKAKRKSRKGAIFVAAISHPANRVQEARRLIQVIAGPRQTGGGLPGMVETDINHDALLKAPLRAP